MVYWNNPTKTYSHTVLPYDRDVDPIVASEHSGEHCLFFQPMLPKSVLQYQQKLTDLSNWANNRNSSFIDDERNFYDIANLVKLNLWIADIRKQGIVKPLLIAYTGEDQPYLINNGESRLRCLEVIPEIEFVDCFITTHRRYAHKFKLPYIENFDQFAEICKADIGQEFLFRFTDRNAPYGLDWYETSSRKTGSIMPAQELCVSLIKNYLNEHPSVEFSPDWFSTAVDWDLYKNC